jgi:transcriptional regulator with XRE-family HTH domain
VNPFILRYTISERLMAHPGKSISSLRVRYGLTQADLAAKAKTSRAYIARIETERQYPSIDVLERIAKAFDLPTAFMFMDREDLPSGPIYEKLANLLDQLVSLKIASKIG